MDDQEKLIAEFTINYMGKLFYFCLKKTSSGDEAEELTQDIALNVISALSAGTKPVNFAAWVWKIARNRYSAWADRKHKAAVTVLDTDISGSDVADEHTDVLSAVIKSEQLSLLRRELAFISNDYRRIIVAYYIDNRSIRDISRDLSLSEDTVKQRLHRARNMIKEGMDMSREFGVRSYDPDEISYVNECDCPGKRGQPWVLIDPKLNQNIYLEGYDNPQTAEKYAIALGVALPYMEDILEHLVRETMLIKTNNKYETAFVIISRAAQEKLHRYYQEFMPKFLPLLEENADRLMAQYNEAGVCYYGDYVSYDDAKWTILMNFYKDLYRSYDSSPKVKLGSTPRPDDGRWDIVAFEKADFMPDRVGFHSEGCGFYHYRFGYMNIAERTPPFLTEEEKKLLRAIVDGYSPNDKSVADKLVEYGFARREGSVYIPNVVVTSSQRAMQLVNFYEKKQYSAEFGEHMVARGRLISSMYEMISEMNSNVREILFADLPKNIRCDERLISGLVNSICGGALTLGYLLVQAITDGWLRYDDSTSRSVGVYFDLQ